MSCLTFFLLTILHCCDSYRMQFVGVLSQYFCDLRIFDQVLIFTFYKSFLLFYAIGAQKH